MNDSDSKDDERTLGLLDAIERRSDVSQRHLADSLGIALGLTNSYLKRCARKGYIKIKEVPANRYLYFVTPKGFAEKARLTARFLSTSLNFYRQSMESCGTLFEICHEHHWERMVLCGASDLAEIAHLRSMGYPIAVVGIYDPLFEGAEFSSLPAWQDWNQAEAAEAYMITGLQDPLEMYWDVRRRVEEKERVLVPHVLGLEAAINSR